MGSTTGSIIISVKGKEVVVSTTAPSKPKNNELWLDTNTNILKYYNTADLKWHNVNDMSSEFGKVYEELKTNYYTKTESDDSVKTLIGSTTITKSDGKTVNMKDALNEVIDTANEHTSKIGDIETKFGDYSTIEDVNTKITEVKQTAENYTIDAIKNLNLGTANLFNGSMLYTEDNKLSITATKNAYYENHKEIYADLKENETYTVNCQADSAWGTENISAELMCTNESIVNKVHLFTLYTNYSYSQTNIDKYSEYGYTSTWVCRAVGNLKTNDIARILVYNTTTKTNNYILVKITKVISNARVEATSLGCLMTEYNMPLLISGYSYNQTGIDKYSTYGYSGAWIVTDVSKVAINDIVRIRLTNSTTNEYNYIIAKVTKINSTNKSVTSTSLGACVVGSSGGIVCKTNDTISLKCRASGGASELQYKYEGNVISTGETVTLQDWSDNDSYTYIVNSDVTGGLDITVSIKDKGNNIITSNTIRLFVNIADDGSGYEYPSNVTVVDTIKAWLVDNADSNNSIKIYPTPYTFKCVKSGRYYMSLGVNKNSSTHLFWNFKLERGNYSTDWSINPVEDKASLKVSSDKINAVVSSLDSEGSITLTDKMAEVVADTISLNGTVKVNGDMLVDGAVTVDKIATDSITTDKIAADAIKSKNYIEPDETTTPYSKDGTFLNLNNGSIISPVFAVDPENEKGYLKNIEITGGSISQESLIDESSDGSETRVTSKLEIRNGNIALIPYFNGKPYALGALYLSCGDSASAMGDGKTAEIILGSIQNGINTRIDNNGIDTNYICCRGYIETGIEGSKRITIDGKDNSAISAYGLGHLELSMFNDKYGLPTSIKYGVVVDGSSFRPCGNGDQVITDAFGRKCAPLHLGYSDNRWVDVWIKSGVITTSDRNEKHDIEDLPNDLVTSFILGIQPKSYKFNDGKSGRTHYGMISQDIEELLESLGMSSLDFAGFIKSPKTEEYIENAIDENGEVILKPDGTPVTKIKTKEVEGEYIYSLRYEEFISPLIKFVQIQNERIDKLENDILKLKNKNTELENKYNDLLSRVEKLENTEGSN